MGVGYKGWPAMRVSVSSVSMTSASCKMYIRSGMLNAGSAKSKLFNRDHN